MTSPSSRFESYPPLLCRSLFLNRDAAPPGVAFNRLVISPFVFKIARFSRAELSPYVYANSLCTLLSCPYFSHRSPALSLFKRISIFLWGGGWVGDCALPGGCFFGRGGWGWLLWGGWGGFGFGVVLCVGGGGGGFLVLFVGVLLGGGSTEDRRNACPVSSGWTYQRSRDRPVL